MFKPFRKLFSLVVTLVIAMAFPLTALAAAGSLARMSVASNNTQGDDNTYNPTISADGRYVAFWSYATNLVSGDTNGLADVFVRDTQTNQTRRVSVASNGTQGNNFSGYPAISADGRYVVFQSDASNLVSSDTNNASDIFLRDLQSNTTTRISIASDGTPGDSHSYAPVISADNHYVAFSSASTNLVPGDNNGAYDIFLRDLQTNTTTRVSMARSGLFITQANGSSFSQAISADGSYVAYQSDANNLANGDTNGVADIFITHTTLLLTDRVSVASNGSQGSGGSSQPSITADGRYVAFTSDAYNLVSGDTNSAQDVFVRDTQSGTTRRVSVAGANTQGSGASSAPAISGDGRYVAFVSLADNLGGRDINGLADIFLRDLQTNTNTRISIAPDGSEANGSSESPAMAITTNGTYVAFASGASNLVNGDSNQRFDVFLYTQRVFNLYMPVIYR